MGSSAFFSSSFQATANNILNRFDNTPIYNTSTGAWSFKDSSGNELFSATTSAISLNKATTIGAATGTTTGHLIRSSTTSDFALTVSNLATGNAGAEGLDVVVGDTTSDDAFRVRAGSTILFTVKGSGEVTVGPAAGSASVIHNIRNRAAKSVQVININKDGTAANDTSNYFIGFYSAGDNEGYIWNDSSGVLAFLQDSDRTLKTNIRSFSALAIVKALPASQFDWIDGSAKNVYGFIAQDVQAVLPESVATSPDKGTLMVSDGQFVPILWGAVREQQQIIEELHTTLTEMRAQLSALEARLAALESK